ncbi:uncharacterized protein F4817DRAFT_348727 [Daldinia loculata]|uniref:uncharacterized protein n=1 Tax=Daldinia loculata TaxID=103429 RepID=UPI0020C57ED1|nr:uncharacterized protein F4817DRAFT_348727 [Daldinia loculata]KAI1643712.1 hypothetical protein F4817DRAFT_348727 [Daldinia loculata]
MPKVFILVEHSNHVTTISRVPRTEMAPKQQLCDECLQLDLTPFFKSKLVAVNGCFMMKYFIPRRGPVGQPKSTDCVVCTILSRSRSPDLREMGTFATDRGGIMSSGQLKIQ